jgi:hypothetical protein
MESDSGAVDATTAAAELAALDADRAALAERVVQPWWFDALLGLLVAGFISSYSSHDIRVIMGALVLFGAAIHGLMAIYRRITGLWVNGLRPGPTRRAIRVWFVVYALVLGAAAAFEFLLDVRGAMVVGGVVLGVAVAYLSQWWTRIYVAELRGEL